MHNLLKRGKIRSQVINVPEGLPELLSDITREVLRCQPTTECLCQFMIDYLQSVINTRDKARIANSIIDRALRMVDEVIADLCICSISKEKSDYMSEAMEECFRRFLAQRRCEKAKPIEMIKFNDLDMLDELVQKCKFTDDELKVSKPVIESAYRKFVNAYLTSKDSAGGTDCLHQYFQRRETVRMEQRLREESAIKIQCNFRGYLARKSLFLNEPVQPAVSAAPETGLDPIQLDLAALRIQRFFRRHRSELKSFDAGKVEKTSSQEACSLVPNVSLTGHPADHQDAHDDNYEAAENLNRNQQENQSELSLENLKDHEESQSRTIEAGEDAAEKDLNNDFPHNAHDDNYEAEENLNRNQQENQSELSLENLKDHEESQSRTIEAGEDAAEKDLNNDFPHDAHDDNYEAEENLNRNQNENQSELSLEN